MSNDAAAVHSVVLEFLRTGTPHNQTLSPGVSYIALCGSRPQTEFQLQVQQHEFDDRLGFLRYSGSPDLIQVGREYMEKLATGALDGIPTLRDAAGEAPGWMHLRLVIAPKELAMLPFELALTPQGLQGAGEQSLLLNAQRRTTLTREIRQVAARAYAWPGRPKVLFAWAEPAGSVPHDEHAAELQAALAPWFRPIARNPEPVPDVGKLFTEVPNATVETLRAAFAAGDYTHVHILAHGTEAGGNFALALHGANGGVDAVDGSRLADALSVVNDTGTRHPAVVVVSACDSGNAGGVIRPGASLAHALHGSGVPLVLASQFPFSKEGSVTLVRALYPRLFCGEDPRTTLFHVRRELRGVMVPQLGTVHDWASLVAYARFPEDLDNQLAENGLAVELDMMRTANAWVDHVLEHGAKVETTFADVAGRLDGSIQKLEARLGPAGGSRSRDPHRAENIGLLGSAYKRKAEHLYRMAGRTPERADALRKESRQALEKAQGWYRQGAALMSHWAATQYLSITAVLEGTLEPEAGLWTVARFRAEQDLDDPTERIWAMGTLAELHLLWPFTAPAERFKEMKAEAMDAARAQLKGIDEAGNAFAKESTARQLERYMGWWRDLVQNQATARLAKMAEELRKCLPALEDCRS